MQFYPNFALFSTFVGMNHDHDFVQVSELNEYQKKVFTKNGTLFPQIQVKTKKKVFTKNGTLFSPNSCGHLRSDAHQSQIIGGDADRRVARNSQWGAVLGVSGRSPSRWRPMGVWGRSPQRSKILRFFAKITSF